MLLTTGITPLPEEVSRAMSRPMIDGHGEEAFALVGGVLRRVQELMGTRQDLFLFPAAGTGALEASIVNHLAPGDRVLACVNGFFSSLYADIARAHGVEVIELCFQAGEGVSWERVVDMLVHRNQDIRAILITHHETSTGALTDMRGAKTVREYSGALLMLNALSSLGGTAVAVDEWDVDVAVVASHKGLMCPPGVAFVAVSPRARALWHEGGMRRAYWDLRRLSHWMERGIIPFDPPLPVIYALDCALGMLKGDDGRATAYARTQSNADRFRGLLRDSGAETVALPSSCAPNATVLRLPAKSPASWVRACLRDRFDIHVSPGLGELAEETIRVNHQGWVFPDQMTTAADALRSVLQSPTA